MLRIIQNTSPAGATNYYSSADYYSEGQELVGHWRGEGARRLGVSGTVQQEQWDALCDNRHPLTGLPLTVRRKDNRRVGYDFNFHAPKSLSLLYALTQDDRLLEAFRASVDETMRDMEAEMKTRVRRDGRDEDRVTGNLAWGEFVHLTARPVGGVPDPHLHAHCFVFNATYDRDESRWKAGQFAGLKRDAPYFEAKFHSRMARRMEELGLPTRRTRAGWEVEGVSPELVKRFSRRKALIDEKAKELGADASLKDQLGAKTRERKAVGLGMEELRAAWRSRLTPDESRVLDALGERIGGGSGSEDERAMREAVGIAVEHCFERAAVVPERRLIAKALRQALGKGNPERVLATVAGLDLVRAERDGQSLVTTREVLKEEQAMLNFARRGRGTCAPLGAATHQFRRPELNDGQRRAVLHVLTSPDRVIMVRGAAGTGKTTMMKEVVEAIEAGGRRVVALAPSAEASRGVLRDEGFQSADTVARMLVDEDLQERARGQVLWVDEAGLLGSRSMVKLFDLAGRLNARVVLSGDRRQHGSVERGAALRLLEEEAGVVLVEIMEIKRQRGDYKRAIQALAEGRTQDGFGELDRLGWIKESPEEERYRVLAAEYVSAVESGKTALVVSPTHAEGERITGEIRGELRRRGRLAAKERSFLQLGNKNLTVAERRDATNYAADDVLVFHQNAPGHGNGERVAVAAGHILPLKYADRFQLFQTGAIALAPGDLVRITRNGKTADGRHRLNNGSLYRVRGFSPKGDIVLTNGWQVARDFGHLAHGYAVTSYASQGKTVDRVLIGQSWESFPASSREQFYVSASRGRERVTVYCDSKAALLDAVSRGDDRLAASDLLARRDRAALGRRASWQRDEAERRDPVQREQTREVDRGVLIHEG